MKNENESHAPTKQKGCAPGWGIDPHERRRKTCRRRWAAFACIVESIHGVVGGLESPGFSRGECVNVQNSLVHNESITGDICLSERPPPESFKFPVKIVFTWRKFP